MTQDPDEPIDPASIKDFADYITDVVTGEIRLTGPRAETARRLLGPANVDPDDIRTLEDFEKAKDKAFAYLMQLMMDDRLPRESREFLDDMRRIYLESAYGTRFTEDEIARLRRLRDKLIRTMTDLKAGRTPDDSPEREEKAESPEKPD